jgi:hypothetical protein
VTLDPLDEIPAECGKYWKWEPPPVGPSGVPQGDGESNLIYTSVGVALSQWEIVEWAFSKVFSAFMEANQHAAERVYGALEGGMTKRTVLEQAAQAAFRQRQVAQEYREAWKKLKCHYHEANDRRNEIAHGQVVHVRNTPGMRPNYFLVPRYNARKNVPVWESQPDSPLSAIGLYRYTSADIGRWTKQFGELDTWATVFEAEYASKYPRRS